MVISVFESVSCESLTLSLCCVCVSVCVCVWFCDVFIAQSGAYGGDISLCEYEYTELSNNIYYESIRLL